MSSRRDKPRRILTGLLACCCSLAALRCSLLTDTDGLAGADAGAGAEASTDDGGSLVDSGTSDVSDGGPAAGEVFASGQTGVFGLARFGDDLYWTSTKPGGEVASCPLAACVTPTVVSSGAKAGPMAVLGRVYWLTPGTKTISYTNADGGAVGQFENFALTTWIAASSTTVFVTEQTGGLVKLQGNPPYSTTTFLGFDPFSERVAVKGGAVAWTSRSTTSLRYCGSGGCDASTSIVVSNENALALALDASFLFWTTTDGRIRSATHDGVRITSAVVSDVVTNVADPSAVAPDEASPFLYFVSRGSAAGSYLDGIVGKVLKTGGPVTVLARGQARPADVLVTDTHVYWANEYDGTIRRALK